MNFPKGIIICWCLFLVLLMRNVNGMATFQLGLPQDDKETINRGMFFSPLGGTSLKYPEARQNERNIMDDVRICCILY